MIDLGCGDGRLLAALLADPRYEEIVGVDASAAALERCSARRREPLHRVHECVFGVLALASEPVDPRL